MKKIIIILLACVMAMGCKDVPKHTGDDYIIINADTIKIVGDPSFDFTECHIPSSGHKDTVTGNFYINLFTKPIKIHDTVWMDKIIQHADVVNIGGK